MKLISNALRELDNGNLSRVSFIVFIIFYFILHTVVMFIMGVINISNNQDGIFAILRGYSNLLFIPLNTVFLMGFCYIMFIRARAVPEGILRKSIVILISLSIIPFFLFCLRDEFISNPNRDFFPIMLRYADFKVGLSESLGFNWELIDVVLPLVLLLPKNKSSSLIT